MMRRSTHLTQSEIVLPGSPAGRTATGRIWSCVVMGDFLRVRASRAHNLSARGCLDHETRPWQGRNRIQREAGGGCEYCKLLARALAAARVDEHVEVRELCLRTLVGGSKQALDDKQPGIPMHGEPAVAKDVQRFAIVPI